jgi:hypothetical protein
MALGRTDEQEIPSVTEAPQRRNSVWSLFGETHLGQRSFAPHQVGRTHDRTRTQGQIMQKTLEPKGPSTHVTGSGPVAGRIRGFRCRSRADRVTLLGTCRPNFREMPLPRPPQLRSRRPSRQLSGRARAARPHPVAPRRRTPRRTRSHPRPGRDARLPDRAPLPRGARLVSEFFTVTVAVGGGRAVPESPIHDCIAQ